MEELNSQPTQSGEAKPPMPDPLLQPDQPIKKSPQGSKAPLLFLLALIMLIAGIGYYWFSVREEAVPESSENTQQSQVVSELDKVELKEDKEQLKDGSVLFLSETTNRYVVVDADKESSMVATLVKKDPSSNLDYEKLYSELVTRHLGGFMKVELLDDEAVNGKYERYEGADADCTLRLEWPEDFDGNVDQTAENAGNVYLFCADFDQVKPKAEFIESFYDAYLEGVDDAYGDKNNPLLLNIESSKVKDSTITGYQYVIGGASCVKTCGGSAVVFTREINGSWEFVYQSQDGVPCEEVTTTVARNALADHPCWKDASVPADDRVTTVGEYYEL